MTEPEPTLATPEPVPLLNRILIVDDDRLVGRAILRLMRKRDAVHVLSGSAALEALKTFEALGSRDQVHCRINRALCLLALGRPDEARDAFEVGLAQCLERRLVTIRAAVHVFLLPCFVADNRWSAWDEHLTQAEELLEATSFTDVDVGLMARLAGQMAMQAGHRERAVRVLQIARAQWARLQRADELTGIELMLAHLQSA